MIVCEALGIDLSSPKSMDVYIVSRGEEAQAWALSKLPELRDLGLKCSMDHLGRSIKAQMKEANRENTRFAIIVGESELESGQFTLRNMTDSSESQLEFSAILDAVK